MGDTTIQQITLITNIRFANSVIGRFGKKLICEGKTLTAYSSAVYLGTTLPTIQILSSEVERFI